MRRSTLVICALLTVATFGCDTVDKVTAKLKLAWDKVRGRPTATQTAPPRPATDTAAARLADAQEVRRQQPPPPPPPPPPRPPRTQGGGPVMRDVPYVSNDTGTIAPGMAEREVYALWGSPAAVRRVGEYTYLFFQNGCEYTCGTMDIVTLKDGAVVDAIVRWDGHRYSGESTSPPGTTPVPNTGGDTLRIPPP
jgi:hypothetical protein